MSRYLDIDLRREMAELAKENAYEVLIQKTSRKIRCSCFNEKYNEPDTKCPKCIGTGWLFKFEKQKAFKQSASPSGQIVYTDIGTMLSGYNTFFFEHNVSIDEGDYIWEVTWKEDKPIKLVNLYKVQSVDRKRGPSGSIQYKLIYAQKEVLDKEFKNMYIGKAWRDIT